MKTLPLKVAVVSCTLDHTIAGKESSNAVDGRLAVGMGSTENTGIIPNVALFPRGGDSNENKNHSKDSKAKRGSSKKKKKGSRKKRDTPPVGSSDENDDVSSSNERKNNDKGAAATGIVEEILGQDDYYMVLGISRTAAKTEIKKAYRKRAVQTHPDKTGGDRRAFDKVSEAYDVLSDDDKRQVYNRFGKDALDGTTGSSTSPYQDLFRSMFRQQQQAQANRSVRYQLQVTLEDLYNGKTHNIEVGSPYSRNSGKKSVTCHIPKGSSSGQRIVLSGEMDFTDDVPGDIVFILSQAPHPVFSRKGSDLAMELTISLEEALCGFCRKIKHLNGNDVWIESARNEDKPVIIQTGDVQALSGYGMPRQGTNDFGDLFIQFRVEMPKPPSGKCTLSDKEQHELSRLLTKLAGGQAKKQHRKVESLAETSSLTVASIRDFGRPSGHTNIDGDDHIYEDEGGEFQSFFSSGGFFGSGPVRSSFYFGGAKGGYEDDSSDTQCQQM